MSNSRNPRLHDRAVVLLVTFGLQFLAGMLLNLFATLPANHPGSNASNYFSGGWHGLIWALSTHGGWELSLYVYLAVLLVVGSIALFVEAVTEHSKNWSIVSTVTALFTIGAFFNGLSFINYGHNVSFMIMATCWLVAVVSLILGLEVYDKPAKA